MISYLYQKVVLCNGAFLRGLLNEQRQVEKMRGEGVVQTLTGVRVVIARVAMVYGEGDVYGLGIFFVYIILN